MIITCPHCETRYQVAYEAIGSAGRKVQCAHCSRSWDERAAPAPIEAEDVLFDPAAEAALDQTMAEEERKLAVEVASRVTAFEQEQKAAARIDPALMRKRQRAFNRRKNTMFAQLPLSRVRRTARIAGVMILLGIVGVGYFGRTIIVTQFPAMAGVYESLGLGVNVMGLDFANVNTLQTLRDGREVLIVSGDVVGLNPDPVTVPPVVVTLLDQSGKGIYEWSVTPSVHDLMAGERVLIETRLNMPPGDASSVRLSFTGGTGAAAKVGPTEMAEATSGAQH